MIDIKDKSLCSGCSACFSICPENCIKMSFDDDGFLYPIIDTEKCIGCGLCESVCGKYHLEGREHLAFACINKDDKIREESSSGGVFYLLAQHIIERGGVVFGAAFDDEFVLSHTAVSDIKELYKLQGSKYLQSRMGNSYKTAKKALDDGKLVLFSGTPCQTDGFRKYLKKDYDNLILQDIVCHGVPSEKVWKKYIDHKRACAHSDIDSVSFRNKKLGWKNFSMLIKFKNLSVSQKTANEDLFLKPFLMDLSLRPSCFNCAHKGIDRMSDITLADFWGVENVIPEMYDDMGTSLVLIHSEKGKKLFESIQYKLRYKEADINEALNFNKAALVSPKIPENRDAFMNEIDNLDYKKCVLKYMNVKFIDRVKAKIKALWRKK